MKLPPLIDIVDDWLECRRCHLCDERRSVVFGDGNPEADILIIGEGPGENEDIQGLPFIGDSGEILDQFLEAVGLSRQEDCFITNIVGCRPTVESEGFDGKMKVDNRPPNKVEREACWPRIQETIYRVDPYLIITMGGPALSQVMGKQLKITALRGRMQEMTLEGRHTTIKYPVLPMFHPSYLMRNQNKTAEGPWDQTAGDFAEACLVIDRMREVYRGITPPDREVHDG